MQWMRPPRTVQFWLVLHRLPEPSTKWRNGICNLATHISHRPRRLRPNRRLIAQSLQTFGRQITFGDPMVNPPVSGGVFYFSFSKVASSTQTASTFIALRMSASDGKDGAMRMLRSRGHFGMGKWSPRGELDAASAAICTTAARNRPSVDADEVTARGMVIRQSPWRSIRVEHLLDGCEFRFQDGRMSLHVVFDAAMFLKKTNAASGSVCPADGLKPEMAFSPCHVALLPAMKARPLPAKEIWRLNRRARPDPDFQPCGRLAGCPPADRPRRGGARHRRCPKMRNPRLGRHTARRSTTSSA